MLYFPFSEATPSSTYVKRLLYRNSALIALHGDPFIANCTAQDDLH
uniref:Uncharacterized protein n=1 Tax=Pseudomonas aeruginosa TaxID=287 RepID=A0A7S6C711_PSEAI|nr:hypothetical protein [Pseudomonas aeruginosa]